MPIKELDAGTGDTVRVLEVDGYYTPTFDFMMDIQEEEFRSIPEWKGRTDDVLICAYPKSGTHWLWEVTSMLHNGSADRVKLIKETSMLEGVSQATYNGIPSPRVLNSHLPLRLLPKDILKLGSKIVFVLRNPKDVCVSFYNHHYRILEYKFQGKWDDYVDRFMRGLVYDVAIHANRLNETVQMVAATYTSWKKRHIYLIIVPKTIANVDYGSWFDYILQWEQVIRDCPDLPIHVMAYEDMKAESIKEITKLSKFLDIKADKGLVEEIADKCDFGNMKKEKDPLEDKSEWREGQPGMYRKGQVGDWKNWFTVAQSERFDSYYAQRMAGSKFTFRYS